MLNIWHEFTVQRFLIKRWVAEHCCTCVAASVMKRNYCIHFEVLMRAASFGAALNRDEACSFAGMQDFAVATAGLLGYAAVEG